MLGAIEGGAVGLLVNCSINGALHGAAYGFTREVIAKVTHHQLNDITAAAAGILGGIVVTKVVALDVSSPYLTIMVLEGLRLMCGCCLLGATLTVTS